MAGRSCSGAFIVAIPCAIRQPHCTTALRSGTVRRRTNGKPGPAACWCELREGTVGEHLLLCISALLSYFVLPLPSGQALVTGGVTQIYAGNGSANPTWAPKITVAPTAVTRGSTYGISGTQFNGLSQAAAVGDEFNAATNYPLVRITNVASGHVVYARTHGHSAMGVATGSAPVSTLFDVPANTETGASSLVVVANGIASPPASVAVN